MTDRGFYFRWFIGGIVMLLIVAGACYLWYHYDTAPYRREAAKTEEFARQWEKDRQAQQKRSTETEQATDGTAVESDMQSAEKKRTDPVTKDTEPSQTDKTEPSQAGTPAQNAETADVPVSPYGFGPYPEVPEDMPGKHLYTWPAGSAEAELLNRVLIKLWTSGERNFRGGSIENGKVYPHYNDVVYVTFYEYESKRRGTVRYASSIKSGPHVRYTAEDLLNPPPHLRVLDLETSGIDPYQYLDLPYKRKGKK